MEIKTQRLLIRNFVIDDAEKIFELDTDPDVMRFIGGKRPESVEDSCETLKRQFIYYEKNPGLGVFACELNDTGKFIGWGALKYLDTSDKIEVGYRLRKKFWGFGYATEITKALLKHAFENLHLKEVYGVTQPDNTASQKVLLKAGLEFNGIDKYYNTDLKVYKILNINLNQH